MRTQMRTGRITGALLMVGVVVLALGVKEAFASGTATASATAAADGTNCGKISKPSGVDTGGMTVLEVKINGQLTTAYTVKAGTNDSTRPVITFSPALKKGDKVEVTLSTRHEGTYKVNLELEQKKGDC